jgi:hypothetical protein
MIKCNDNLDNKYCEKGEISYFGNIFKYTDADSIIL